MIPLEFLATMEEADKIAGFARKHYDQTEILYYPINDHVRCWRRIKADVTSSARRSKVLTRRK
jgi:hypothetical protein